MPAITATKLNAAGAIAVTETTLDGSDTFVFANKTAILTLRNATGGSLTPVIDGDGGTTVTIAGVGVIDVSAGYSLGAIAAGDVITIVLNSVNEYLKGTISINSGTGLVATLYELY